MEKGKQLFSYLGSVFAFCILALVVFLPGVKADAALTVDSINYEDSTITIASDSGDSILYFSDKNKKKWETVMNPFDEGKCTMNISWISTTKDYVITFKGDKTSETTDILTVTLPKQVTNFKAKYNQVTGEITFTNAGTNRQVEYRKNNTTQWKSFGDVTNQSSIKESLRRLCENGATVYFRLKSEPGTSATAAGQRPSKEVACKITKKTTAPTVTIDTATSTIPVQSGWQVRLVNIEEISGVQYVIGTEAVTGDVTGLSTTAENGWRTFQMTRNVPLQELAPAAMYKTATGGTSDVYLQFRKSATSSTQVSYNTTIKVPKQAAPPTFGADDIIVEYTSSSTFKLTISTASSSNVFEYAILDSTEVSNNTIIDLDGTNWKTISSSASVEIKKADAPDNSQIFIRKKAIGKVGDEDFELATDYVSSQTIRYPSTEGGKLDSTTYNIIDGVYTNEDGSSKMAFSVRSQYNVNISTIEFSTEKNPSGGDTKATVTSTVKKDTTATDDYKYIISATITNLTLGADIRNKLNDNQPVTLYAYILLNTTGTTKEEIKSNDTQGLILKISPKSEIETPASTATKDNAVNVTRIIGASSDSVSSCQYDSFWFKMTLGDSTANIDKVQLGNYTLTSSDYSYDNSTGKFTVNVSNFENKDEVFSSYGKSQSLVITLSNGEVLDTVKIKLVPPVSLNSTYAWVFAAGSLPKTEQEVTTTTTSGTTTTKTEYVNNYSVNYTVASDTVNNVKVESVVLTSAELAGNNILYDYAASTKEITFYNTILTGLNAMPSTPVMLTFEVTYSNNKSMTYTIQKGCSFTIV